MENDDSPPPLNLSNLCGSTRLPSVSMIDKIPPPLSPKQEPQQARPPSPRPPRNKICTTQSEGQINREHISGIPQYSSERCLNPPVPPALPPLPKPTTTNQGPLFPKQPTNQDPLFPKQPTNQDPLPFLEEDPRIDLRKDDLRSSEGGVTRGRMGANRAPRPARQNRPADKAFSFGWVMTSPSDPENRERRVDLLSDIGRVGNEGEGGSPKRTPVDFFDGAGPPQQFQSLSQSSTSPSPRRRGAADKEIHFQKEKVERARLSPIRKRVDSSGLTASRRINPNSGTKQSKIKGEIEKWAGGTGSNASPSPQSPPSSSWSTGGAGSGSKLNLSTDGNIRQQEIARQVAMWAAPVDDKKKEKKGNKTKTKNHEGGPKKERKMDDLSYQEFTNSSIDQGTYGCAVWKTNNKVKSLCARVTVKSLLDGELLICRTLEFGKQDLVSKLTFSVSESEAPANINIIVSKTRCPADISPVSVTLQLLTGSNAIDIPLSEDRLRNQRQRVTMIEPRMRPNVGVKLWRTLLVTIFGARDLPTNLSGVYATVHVASRCDRTHTIWNCKEPPVWKSHFDFELSRSPDRYTMLIALWEVNEKRDACFGQIRIPVWTLFSQELLSDWFALEPVESCPVSGGRLHVQMILEQGNLLVKVLDGLNLLEVGSNESPDDENCFVIIQLGKITRCTKAIPQAATMVFGEEFVFGDQAGGINENTFHQGEVLIFSIWSEDESSFFGQIKLPLSEIKPGKLYDQTYALTSRFESKRIGGKKKLGDVKLELQFSQSTILASDFYKDLLILLVEGDGTFLSILGKAIPTSSREKLARVLSKIFRATGTAIDQLTRFAIREISLTDDPRVLFRGNTLTTKLIDAYQKLIGGDYLESVLKATIQRVYELKRAIDLDPLRVDNKDQLPKNRALFEKELNVALKSIFNSANRCPEEMKMIYSILGEKIVSHFGEKQKEKEGENGEKEKEGEKKEDGNGIVKYTVVNSFLILRLFVPAFLTPTVFQLMTYFPPEHTARSLTLIGKTIQNLANFTYFSEKDSYMVSVNELITENIEKMKDFYSIVSKAPAGWTETPQKTDIWLDKELALLHEIVRTHHIEIRSHADLDRELFVKIMNACHIVIKEDQNPESPSDLAQTSSQPTTLSPPPPPPLLPLETTPPLPSPPFVYPNPSPPVSPFFLSEEFRGPSSDFDHLPLNAQSETTTTTTSQTSTKEMSEEEFSELRKEIRIEVFKFNSLLDTLEKAMDSWEFEEAARLRDRVLSEHARFMGMRVGLKDQDCLELIENVERSLSRIRPLKGPFCLG